VANLSAARLNSLTVEIKELGRGLGFSKLGIAATDLAADEAHLDDWLAAGRHGTMEYMQRHGRKRTRPDELVPGTVRVISARMDYWPAAARDGRAALADRHKGYVARYALGRDYHKVLRQRLRRLADAIAARVGPFGYRVFVDSAPVLEKALARDAGLGWIGKHTNLLDRDGSWFLLGELYTDLPLPGAAHFRRSPLAAAHFPVDRLCRSRQRLRRSCRWRGPRDARMYRCRAPGRRRSRDRQRRVPGPDPP
jgi:epoxyqueuosine reductase